MATQYTLDVIHQGTDCGDFCVYQTYDDQPDDIRSLVWFSKTAHPGTKLSFQWNIDDRGIAWSEQGDLTPGVVFRASQLADIAPANNTLMLRAEQDAFCFSESDSAAKAGKLGVVCDSTLPTRTVSVGVAISGKPSQAVVAAPGLKYAFSSSPRYWIAFGKFEEGEVIDINRLTEKFEIQYPVNTCQRTVELTPNNTFADV